MDRLTKIHSDGLSHYYYCDASNSRISSKYQTSPLLPDAQPILCGDIVDRLAYYEDLVEQGYLIALPCKVGDTVYWIKGKAILEVYIQWFETNAYGWCACGTYPPMSTPTFRFADFGKTVFRAREEAEAALGGEEDDKT